MHSEPVELVAGALYALGETEPNDGRISWAPPAEGKYEPINSYLLLEGSQALLIDPGVAAHEKSISAQLAQLLGPDTEIGIFCTRFEGDCLTNLGAVIRDFNITSIFGGGVSNPFDFFDDVSSEEQVRDAHEVEILRQHPGDRIAVGEGRSVEIVSTSLRVLTTFWLFDDRTGTLFTSDALGYEAVDRRDRTDLIHDDATTLDPGDAGPRMLTKFDWILDADPAPFIEQLDDVFATRDVRIVAPGHGRIARGPAAVEAYHATTRELLSAVAERGTQ